MNKEAILNEVYQSAFNDELEKIAYRQVEDNPKQRAASALIGLTGGAAIGVPSALALERKFGTKGAVAGLVGGALAGVGINRLINYLDVKKPRVNESMSKKAELEKDATGVSLGKMYRAVSSRIKGSKAVPEKTKRDFFQRLKQGIQKDIRRGGTKKLRQEFKAPVYPGTKSEAGVQGFIDEMKALKGKRKSKAATKFISELK